MYLLPRSAHGIGYEAPDVILGEGGAVSLVPRHSWLGRAVGMCVFGLVFWLHPATPGWGVGVCVCWCGRSACTFPLLAGVRAVCVCVWARVSPAPRHSWLGCWAVCVLVWALRLHLSTPGWGARRGCVCLGSGFGCAPRLLAGVLGCVCAGVGAQPAPRHSWLGCAPWVCVFGLDFCNAPPLLAGVLGCVCAGVGAPLAPRHSWLGCAPWVCVFGLGTRLHPATPGVCWCGRLACTPPLLAGMRAVGVCVWARVSGAPRHSWRVLLRALRLHPATAGLGARRGCVFLGSGFGCTPPRLACAGVGTPLAPRHSWLGCAPWVCVFGLGLGLQPATPGSCWCGRSACTPPLLAWVRTVGVCVRARVSAAPRHSWRVLVWALCLHPATPGCGARRGCVCLGSGFGCTPPLLAGVLGCVCAGVGAPLAPRHSWMGCAPWVCVFGLRFRLRPATGFVCALPLLSRICGVWVGCCLAPVCVPWFVACCARSPGLWHLAAVAAWHLSVCLGFGRRRASLVCLVGPRGAPRLVRPGCSRCSGRLSRRRGAFPHTGGLRPWLYWAAARGTRRPAENRALCACRWPPPRRGRWARSASYPFGAPQWACPLRVPPALVLGCVRRGGWRVWTRSLTRLVSRTVRRSTGDSAGAPGLFRVDADTASCGSEGATPGSAACVRVLALLGRVGRVVLPGAFWCASTFRLAALAFCFAWPPPGWACPRLGPFFFFRCRLPRAPFFSCSSWFPAPGALGLGTVCCLSCWPRASRPSVRSRYFCVARLAVGCCLVVASPPPPLCLAVFLAAAPFLVFFFLVRAPVVSRFLCFPALGALGLGAVLCVFFSSCLSALRALLLSSFLSCLAVGCSLVLGAPPPLPLCLAGFVAAARWPPPPFFFFPCVRPCCLWLSLVSGPGCPGPWRCVLFALWASRFSALRALSPFSVSRLAVDCSLVVAAPPPPPRRLVLRSFFFLALYTPVVSGFLWFLAPVPWASALRVVCFVGLPLLGSPCVLASFVPPVWPLAAPRWLLPPPPPPFVSRGFRRFRSVLCAVCCAVLCVPGCGSALRCCALCGLVLCCCVLCCFAALGWCRCPSCRALWCSPLPWGPVLCGAVFCGVLPRCVCFVVAWWCVLLFAALLCARCVLGCCVVRSLSSPPCAVLCFAVLVRLRCAVRVVRAVDCTRCCGALLCVVLFHLVCCGAVLRLVARGCLLVPCCGALLSVSLCWWCWFVSFPCVCGAVMRCASCCLVPVVSALLSVPRAVACPCVLWCLPGRSAVWWCRSGMSWCLAVLCVVEWCPAPCDVSCGAVLHCGVVLVGCAVRLSALLVFVFPFVLFPFAKNPFCFSVPLKTF